MSNRFFVPDSSPASSIAPSTPDKKTPSGHSFSRFMPDNPSTTPAGPPPSSAASFTPAGAPSDSYLGSSMMRGMTGSKSQNFTSQSQQSFSKNLFGQTKKSSAPLGRSVRGKQRQPSALSRQYSVGDDDQDDEGEDASGEEEYPAPRGSLFRMSSAPPEDEDDADGEVDNAMDAEIDRYFDEELGQDDEEDEDEEDEEDEEEDEDAEGEEEEEDVPMSQTGSDDGDMFLNMRHDDRAYGQPMIGEETEMMLNTPAATERVRKEAQSLYQTASARHGSSLRRQEFQFATIAKDLYSQHDAAQLTEPSELILKTEALVCRLYNEGVGPEDDAEKMDNSLANITYRLVSLWNEHVEELPRPEGEDFVAIGPVPSTEPFEKAAYVAHLVLRMHHTRFQDDGVNEKTPPLTEILFDWMQGSHNLYPDQVREVSRHKPSAACHSLFWQTLSNALLRGNVEEASQLLRNAGWEHVRKSPRGEYAYTGKALENVRRCVAATCDLLDQCPASRSEWDIWNSSWTLFRVQARGALDKLKLFAEGNDSSVFESDDDGYASPVGERMSTMARKAASQIPWDIYENLQVVYGVVLGDPEAIMETAQDWCEATIGLFGWWDDSANRLKSHSLSRSQSHRRSSARLVVPDDYFERLTSAFHLVVQSDHNPNTLSPVEVAIASAFEGNIQAVIGFLRTWSLPVSCSVAEIASLGQWLPPADAPAPLPTGGLDMDDLALLGITQPTTDEVEGIKDTSLVLYARELAGIEHLSAHRDGWEMAIEVLGRMDDPEKSEDTVSELLRDLLATLDQSSSETVDKMWRILNDLGMINFAEETAETFANILATESHRYGEALWYFALSHRPDKVRDVLNLLTSYSLIQSTAYPPEKDLDDHLRDLLRKRTETLEARAKQDLEAAQLLGRMLSGYATLRKFYEIRDDSGSGNMSQPKALALKRQAALALVAVISSSDDNIRGGLYDASRDAVVSEDFLLALLGEATVFVNQSPAVITLEQIDTLLKAIEDVQTVGSRVYTACDEFFDLVLSSGQGLKGSTPADLMKKSTSSLSGSSYVMSGSSMLASHLQKSAGLTGKVSRGWDWRKTCAATTKGEEILRRLRLGLSKDLAALWLEDADGVAVY